MKPALSVRQAQVAELVAKGLPTKQIAVSLKLSVRTVENHIREAAARIPGPANPRHRLTLFFLNTNVAD